MSNRMRNLHMQLSIEYGKESVKIFCWWKKYEKKMADFTNHGGFTLRCLAEDLVPVSVHLKQNIKTPKGLQIIRKAERALLNERVRSINNTLNMLKSQRDTCIDWLERVSNEEWMVRCKAFIEVGREKQHFKTLKRQKRNWIDFYIKNRQDKVTTQDCMASILETIAAPPGKTTPAMCMMKEVKTTG